MLKFFDIAYYQASEEMVIISSYQPSDVKKPVNPKTKCDKVKVTHGDDDDN